MKNTTNTTTTAETNSVVIFLRVKPSLAQRLPDVQKILGKQLGRKATYPRVFEFLLTKFLEGVPSASHE